MWISMLTAPPAVSLFSCFPPVGKQEPSLFFLFFWFSPPVRVKYAVLNPQQGWSGRLLRTTHSVPLSLPVAQYTSTIETQEMFSHQQWLTPQRFVWLLSDAGRNLETEGRIIDLILPQKSRQEENLTVPFGEGKRKHFRSGKHRKCLAAVPLETQRKWPLCCLWTHLFNCFRLDQGELLVLVGDVEGEFDVGIAAGTEKKKSKCKYLKKIKIRSDNMTQHNSISLNVFSVVHTCTPWEKTFRI